MTKRAKTKAARKPIATMPENVSFPVTAEPGQTREQLVAIVAAKGALASAATVRTFSHGIVGTGDIVQLTQELRRVVDASKAGDSGLADEFLIPQAAALNAVFNECMRRAAMNMGEYPEAMERYMRLGLKAQSQCRTSLESLSKIKNPPNVAFVGQANIANGPQQVNNGDRESATEPARKSNGKKRPIELLEDCHGKRVDGKPSSEAGKGDPEMAPLGAIDGAANGRGKESD